MSCFWLIGSFSGADRAQEKHFFTDRHLCVYIPCTLAPLGIKVPLKRSRCMGAYYSLCGKYVVDTDSTYEFLLVSNA